MEELPTSSAAPSSLARRSELLAEEPSKGFIGSLTDFSFVSFVTPTLVRFLYGILLLCVAGSTIYWIFDGSFMGVIWRSLGAPFVLVIGAILSRVFVELIMVAFRILELLRRLDAEWTRGPSKK
jgi:hypothetical protein